jgi:hypothetical protein
MRAGIKQKKINIEIPKMDDFIHKIYIHLSRKVYKKTYLFQKNIPALEIQKNFNELENTVKECILNSIRDSIPVETILRAYMDETCEEEIIEEIKEQIVENPKKTRATLDPKNHPTLEPQKIATEHVQMTQDKGSLKFQDVDYIKNTDGSETIIHSPKDIISLEIKNTNKNNDEKNDDEKNYDDDDDNDKIKITSENFSLDENEFQDISSMNSDGLLFDNIEFNDNIELLI